MSKSIVWRLLRRNISIGQLAGYAVANLVGLVIVLTAVQFYRDVTSARDEDDSFISRDYIIVSKKVSSGIGSLFGGARESKGFSADEIADLERQPWVRRTGKFTAGDFNVSVAVDMGGNQLSTALFLESIPSDFFDISPREWQYTPESGEPVPVIISKDYLTLYNFGFASSRGLPQISEDMMKMIPLRMSLSGNGHQQWLNARIVGFSSRLNTIAVPETFMSWANKEFGENGASDPSRLIIETYDPGNPAIQSYLAAHGYEAAGDKVNSGKAAYLLSIITAVVTGVGVIISLLAVFILLLSIRLLLQKNRSKLIRLMMLGYAPHTVARYYMIIVGVINTAVLAGAIALTLTASHFWHGPMQQIGITSSGPWVTIILGFGLMLLITLDNFTAIYLNINRIFPRPRKKI